MAVEDRASNLRAIIESYGIGVRAGVITPCLADENAFRKLLGLEPAGAEVVANWQKLDGVKTPTTIKKADDIVEGTEVTNEQV